MFEISFQKKRRHWDSPPAFKCVEVNIFLKRYLGTCQTKKKQTRKNQELFNGLSRQQMAKRAFQHDFGKLFWHFKLRWFGM